MLSNPGPRFQEIKFLNGVLDASLELSSWCFFGVVKISLVFCLSLYVGGESTPPRLCSEDAIHATTIHVIPNHSETKSIIFQNGQKFPKLPPPGVLVSLKNGLFCSKTIIFSGHFQKY